MAASGLPPSRPAQKRKQQSDEELLQSFLEDHPGVTRAQALEQFRLIGEDLMVDER
jgi:hypothetical protein